MEAIKMDKRIREILISQLEKAWNKFEEKYGKVDIISESANGDEIEALVDLFKHYLNHCQGNITDEELDRLVNSETRFTDNRAIRIVLDNKHLLDTHPIEKFEDRIREVAKEIFIDGFRIEDEYTGNSLSPHGGEDEQ